MAGSVVIATLGTTIDRDGGPSPAGRSLWRSLCAVLVLLLLSLPQAQADDREETVRRAKAASVLVDVAPFGTGSGFCIRADGYFVTNAHVVDAVGFGGTVELILNAADETERTLKAQVVSLDREVDLALLHVDGVKDLATLTIDDKAKVTETDDVISVGYPFGRLLTADGDKYPSASVNLARVSALRKSKGRLDAIQLDGSINPGHSGGPVLTQKGQVVGVIVSGIRGASVSVAIPAGKVLEFLKRPAAAVVVPKVQYSQRNDPQELRIELLPFDSAPAPAATPAPVAMELSLQPEGGDPRTIPLKKSKESYAASVTLGTGSPVSGPLHVEVRHGKGVHQAVMEDSTIVVDGQHLRLSEIRMISRRSDRHIVATVDGRKSASKITGWERIQMSPPPVQPIPTDLSQAERIDIYAPVARVTTYRYTFTARRGKAVAGEWSGSIELRDVPPGLDVEALEEYEKAGGGSATRLATLKQSRDAITTDLPEQIRVWEERLKTKPVEWTSPKVVERKLASGGKAEPQDDGSFVFINPNVAKDTYTFRLQSPIPVQKITALRLEVLPDKRFHADGPGQYFGNFVLNDLQANTFDRATRRTTPVRFGRASADHYQRLEGMSTRNWFVQDVIDDLPNSGWAIQPQLGQRHVAVFETVPSEKGSPLPAPQADFVVNLVQDFKELHLIGRLRLSVTDAPRPIFSDPLPEGARAVVAIPAAQRTPEQQAVLARMFTDSNMTLRALEAEIAPLEKTAQAVPLVTFLRGGDEYSMPRTRFDVEVQVGGKSILHITRRGLYWEHISGVKPGLAGDNGPSAKVDGATWQIGWRNPASSTGKDTSRLYPIPLGPELWREQVLSLQNETDKKENRERGKVRLDDDREETTVEIDDTAEGSGLYRIRFHARR